MNIRPVRFFFRGFCLAIFPCLILNTAFASTPPYVERKPVLTATDSTPFDDYGVSVALEGDRALIGVPFDATKGFNAGAVYIYKRVDGNWLLQQKLTASDSTPGDQYGWSVDLSGNTAVVGARFDDDKGFNSGSVYIYSATEHGWSEQQKVSASDGASGDQFGRAVVLGDQKLLVGAPYIDSNGTNSGAAYSFSRIDGVWAEQQKLVASDSAQDDQFGWSVAMSGDTALISARFDDDKGDNSGSVYVYRLNGKAWQARQKLTASGGGINDQYGWSLELAEDTAVVSARFDDDKGVNAGTVYVYGRDGDFWFERQKLAANDGDAHDQYGWSVSLQGDALFVGSPFDDDKGYQSGAVYGYRLKNGVWTFQQKFVANDAFPGERYGLATALTGQYALIGAYLDYNKGFLLGSGYSYRPKTQTWGDEVKLLSLDIFQ